MGVDLIHDLHEHQREFLWLGAPAWHELCSSLFVQRQVRISLGLEITEVLILHCLAQGFGEVFLPLLHPLEECIFDDFSLSFPVNFLLRIRLVYFATRCLFAAPILLSVQLDLIMTFHPLPAVDAVVSPVLIDLAHLFEDFGVYFLCPRQERRLTPLCHFFQLCCALYPQPASTLLVSLSGGT